MKSFSLWLESKGVLAYHKTTIDSARSIMENGFSIEKSRKYELGKGIYLSFFPAKKKMPDEVVIECKIQNTDKFLNVSNTDCCGNKEKTEQIFNTDDKFLLNKLADSDVPAGFYTSSLQDKIKKHYRGLILPRIIVCYFEQDVAPERLVLNQGFRKDGSINLKNVE